MPTWDPNQYLRFERERTLPCRDLIARIAGGTPARIIDLGCGTGSSTALLRAQWPKARITGLDSSPEMIAAATASDGSVTWCLADARTWTAEEPFDLVFSNAALHWLPDHAALFPHLLRQVASGGALAVQMPVNFDSPAHRAIREVAESPSWAPRWGSGLTSAHVAPPASYFDWLTPDASGVELWQTEYVHALPDAAAIVEWVKGTTLRPYLDRISAGEREEFLAEITRKVALAYVPQRNGQVLFPFRRQFLVAHR